ncbi:hypothetical protein AB1L42_07590 [Thalassoglobus sp. JC818]|uniref:hypothetical protein n=1 Tax=Thalassoglobus sp. JC818 TaxID=3232136 RepID=UPI00345AD7A3
MARFSTEIVAVSLILMSTRLLSPSVEAAESPSLLVPESQPAESGSIGNEFEQLLESVSEDEDLPIQIERVDAHTEGVTIAVHKSFLSKWINRSTAECGGVRDRILEAEVFGNQCTTTEAHLEMVESQRPARFFVTLSGQTNNQTTSYVRRTRISSRGQYHFHSRKAVVFDGMKLASVAPVTTYQIFQQNYSASTPFDGIPLLGNLASDTALRMANQRQAYVRQNAANRLNQRVISEFDERVNSRVVALNQSLESKFGSLLSRLKFDPRDIATRSTNEHLLVHIGPGADQLATRQFDAKSLPTEGVIVRVQQSFMNDVIERSPLAGLMIPDTILESVQIENGSPQMIIQNPRFGSLVMADRSPLRVGLKNGLVILQANLGFRPVWGPEFPEHRVIVNIEPELLGRQIGVGVMIDELKSIASHETSVFELRRDSFNRMLAQTPRFPSRFSIQSDNVSAPSHLEVTEIEIADGWMQLSINTPDEEYSPPATTESPENVQTTSTQASESLELAASGGE